MTDLIERLRKMPCGSPECDGGAIPHGPTPDGHWEAEQCQICAYIKEAADRLERLEARHEKFLKEFWATNAENERLEGALREMYSAENYEQLCEMLDEALDKEGFCYCKIGAGGKPCVSREECDRRGGTQQYLDKEQT